MRTRAGPLAKDDLPISVDSSRQRWSVLITVAKKYIIRGYPDTQACYPELLSPVMESLTLVSGFLYTDTLHNV
jgi:hypothetical protein